MIRELREVLNINVNGSVLDGVVYYKAKSVCGVLGLRNTTLAIRKVSISNKRKFTVGDIVNHEGRFDIRPWYLTENGLIEIAMLNNNRRTQRIKERIASSILPRIVGIREET